MRQVDAHGLQTSSWGGSVLRADDGLLHMWAAELIDGVGIKSWISNSQVVHAVADTPSRPFAFVVQVRRYAVTEPLHPTRLL